MNRFYFSLSERVEQGPEIQRRGIRRRNLRVAGEALRLAAPREIQGTAYILTGNRMEVTKP